MSSALIATVPMLAMSASSGTATRSQARAGQERERDADRHHEHQEPPDRPAAPARVDQLVPHPLPVLGGSRNPIANSSQPTMLGSPGSRGMSLSPSHPP